MSDKHYKKIKLSTEDDYTSVNIYFFDSSKNIYKLLKKPGIPLSHICGVNERKDLYYFVPDKLKEIVSMGHEIGYHYETLDKASGNVEKAIEIFKEELKEFKKICPIKTISMHGNPLSPYINQDIWKDHDYRKYGIIGDGFLSVDFSNIFYITDTGRNWEFSKYNIKDFPPGYNFSKIPKISSLLEIIELIKRRKYPIFYFNLHPDVWASNRFDWYKKTIWQNLKNQGKKIIKMYRKK